MRINFFLDRVRQKVHRDHQRLAHRVGLVLALFSICYVVLLAWEVWCGHNRHAASSVVCPLAIASVVLHIILGLPHGDVVRIRIGVTAHVVVQACDAVIHALDRCLAADVPNAAHHLVWVLVLYPFSLRVLWRVFCAMRKFPQNKRNHVAEVSLLAFATVVPLVLYLSFNSIACVAFTPAASITCETRMTVNKAVVLSLAITVMLPVYTTLNPVTSIQAIRCDLTPNEWILSFFAGGLLLGTVSLLSQQERMAPATDALLYLSYSQSAFFVGFMMAAGIGLHAGRKLVAPPAIKKDLGSLLLWRILMHASTAISVPILVTLPEEWSYVIGPISYMMCCIHLLVTAEHEGHSRWVLAHFATSQITLVLDVIMDFRSGDYSGVFISSFYLLILVPALYRTCNAFRARAKHNHAAQELVSQTFRMLAGVVPSLVYLAADSAGCLIQHPLDAQWQADNCGARTNANWMLEFHLGFTAYLGLFSRSKSGLDLSMDLIRRLEISGPERCGAVCVALATLIALRSFAQRESENTDVGIADEQTSVIFLFLWLIGISIYILKRQSIQRFRQSSFDNRQPSRSNVAQFWSLLLVGISFITLLVPKLLFIISNSERWRYGAGEGLSTMLCLANFCIFCEPTRATTITLAGHAIVHLTGIALATMGDVDSSGASLMIVRGLRQLPGISLVAVLVFRILPSWINLTGQQDAAIRRSQLSERAFRWLFERGGLLFGLYCYFESMGCFDAECKSWSIANNSVLFQAAMSAALMMTVLTDVRSSVIATLKGRAPQHVILAVTMTMTNWALCCFLFSGREFVGNNHSRLYADLQLTSECMWIATWSVTFRLHTKWARQKPASFLRANSLKVSAVEMDEAVKGGLEAGAII